MISIGTLEGIFSENAADLYKYLKNKNKGGVNNSKGNCFENFVAIYNITKLFNDSVNQGYTFLSAQKLTFIDDFIIDKKDKQQVTYQQIKDVQTLDWISGNRSLQDDFEMQFKVAEHDKIDCTLEMIVSRKDVFDSLSTNLPDKINYVKVVHFLGGGSVQSLIIHNEAVREELIKMCALQNPSIDKLETLATIILGSWDGSNKNDVSLDTLLDKCYLQNPHYIKGFDNKISNRLTEILKSVKHFTFNINNGFIEWKYNGTDLGTLSYRIGSKEFEQFENDLFAEKNIKSFNDLEQYLT